MAQTLQVEHLPNECEALSSKPSTTKKKKKSTQGHGDSCL
jgi:hypothetical protein